MLESTILCYRLTLNEHASLAWLIWRQEMLWRVNSNTHTADCKQNGRTVGGFMWIPYTQLSSKYCISAAPQLCLCPYNLKYFWTPPRATYCSIVMRDTSSTAKSLRWQPCSWISTCPSVGIWAAEMGQNLTCEVRRARGLVAKVVPCFTNFCKKSGSSNFTKWKLPLLKPRIFQDLVQ